MKKQLIFTGIVAVFATAIGLFLYKKSKSQNSDLNKEENQNNEIDSSSSTNVNKDLVLKKGTKGEEVKLLQQNLGSLTLDGDFGTLTENRLWDIFRLNQISLNQLVAFKPKSIYVKKIHDRGKKINVLALYGFDMDFLKEWSKAITNNEPTFDYGIETYATNTGTKTQKVIKLI